MSFSARDIKCAGEMWTDHCDVAKMGDAFADVCDDAQKIGATIAMEILPMSNVRTLETAKDDRRSRGPAQRRPLPRHLAFRARRHRFREDQKPSRDMINSVELDDAAAEPMGSLWDDTLFHRLYPGEGSFDCPAFIEAVEQAGYRGVYGVEVINQAYRKLRSGSRPNARSKVRCRNSPRSQIGSESKIEEGEETWRRTLRERLF